MKRILLSIVWILLIVYSIESIAQESTSYKKKWLFGTNWGGAWENADVHSRLGTGWGLTLEKEIIANNTSLLGFSLRGRYLHTWMWGRESTPFFGVANDNNLNGISNPSIDYKSAGYVYRNFYTKTDEFSLEGLLILNRLRAHSGFKIYGFGGIGATGYLSKINQLDGRGNMYNYSSVTTSPKAFTRSDLNDLWDNTYETNGVEGQNRTSYVLSGAIGIGIGIKLSPNVYLGWEHKYTYTSTDNLDASKLSRDGSKSLKNDRYHYSSLFLTVALGAGSASTQQKTPSKTYYPTPPPIPKPVITLLYPKENPIFLQECYASIKVSITNVVGLNQLTVLVDGNVLENEYYTFSAVTSVLEINKNINGNSVFTIIAQNDSGKDIKYVYINCPEKSTSAILIDPAISIVSASGASCTAHVVAYVKNVSNIRFIEVIKDGVVMSSNTYSFNPYNGMLIIDVPFHEATSISIRAKSNSNTVVQTVNLSCKVPTKGTDKLIAPVIQVTSSTIKKDAGGNCLTMITASVSGITSVNMISITRDGILVNPNNFNWNNGTGILTISNPIVGFNKFLIKATNAAGVATANVTSDCSIQHTVESPIIKLLQPHTPIYTSTTCNETVVMKIEQVSSTSINAIEVKMNNVVLPQNRYSYTISSGLLKIPTVVTTSTDIEVTATNGSNIAKQIVHLVCTNIQAPTIVITSPTAETTVISNCSTRVQARVENIMDVNQLIITNNGTPIPSINYTLKEGTIDVTVFVINKSIITIRAANASGEDQDTVVLICNSPNIENDSANTSCKIPPVTRSNCSTCTDTIRATSGQIIVEANKKVCITNTFTGNVIMNGGQLIICGNATIQSINYNSGDIVIIGTAQFNNMNMNNSSSVIRNYGKATIANFTFNGRLENQGQLTIKSDFNINSGAVFINTGSVNAKLNLNNNNVVCNSGDITVDGNLKDNGDALFTNLCRLFVRGQLHINKTFVNTAGVKVGTATFVSATGKLLLEENSHWLTTDLRVNGTIESIGKSCALMQIKNDSRINEGSHVKGKVDLCDLNGIEFNAGIFGDSVTMNCSCNVRPQSNCDVSDTTIVQVLICHKSTTGTKIAESVLISKKELAAHLAHGDHIGNCTSIDYSAEDDITPPVITTPVDKPTPKNDEEIRVTICHKTNEISTSFETRSIPKSELIEHLAHGDRIGECDAADNPVKKDEDNSTPIGSTNEEMVTICHKPADEFGVIQTISIPKSKLGLHLSHGDHVGACTNADNGNTGGWDTPPPVVKPPSTPTTPSPKTEETIVICHKNRDGSVATITVLKSQLNMHLSHGDHVGACTAADYPVKKVDPPTPTPPPKAEETVVICHKNTDGSVATITVVKSQLNMHLSHGDHVGACTAADYPVKKVDPPTPPPSPKVEETVVICHKNTDGSVATITVVKSQLNMHLSHGDHVGACTAADYPVKKVDPPTPPPPPKAEETVVICHKNTDGSVATITVVKSQLNMHLSHGDHVGACTAADYPVKKVDPPTPLPPPPPKAEETVVICHKNTNGSVATITVVKSQLNMHLSHGDHVGACTAADQPVKKVDPVVPPVEPTKPTPPTLPKQESLVTICHTNEDGTKETQTVPQSQVQQHLNHGDHFGVCTADDMNQK